ncbi:hypothetical protein [Micromonospora rifamycinica]|uniref:Uncharacterized protein n=1 Tax=Micromonospora rifamycinica TaxID=291594 RepID=A0A1C5KEY4_9ACTN|nr:hypothetical protein [Micromonospora rifamycinica]SCG81344.1 hypothetical protein GA0070623_5719 [Micromonospora rifamycinica]
MTDDHSGAEYAADVPRRRRRWVSLVVVSLVLLALGGGGAAAYWEFADRKDEDPGVTACRSAGFVVRVEQGQVAPADEVQRVAELFQRSAHEDLKSAGVTAVGMVQRVQSRRGSEEVQHFDRVTLTRVVPGLIAACENHQVTVKS